MSSLSRIRKWPKGAVVRQKGPDPDRSSRARGCGNQGNMLAAAPLRPGSVARPVGSHDAQADSADLLWIAVLGIGLAGAAGGARRAARSTWPTRHRRVRSHPPSRRAPTFRSIMWNRPPGQRADHPCARMAKGRCSPEPCPGSALAMPSSASTTAAPDCSVLSGGFPRREATPRRRSASGRRRHSAGSRRMS